MIQANELKKNNEVFYDDAMCTVVGIGFGDTVELAGCEGFISITDIEPIPLTPEVLEKCGFVRNGDWFYKEQFFLGYITDDTKFQTEYKFAGVEGGWKLLDVNHLHQLQNLYFALTGTELTITNL